MITSTIKRPAISTCTPGNPSGNYSKVEAARGFMGLCLCGAGRNYFTFQNLKFRNWGYHGGILGTENGPQLHRRVLRLRLERRRGYKEGAGWQRHHRQLRRKQRHPVLSCSPDPAEHTALASRSWMGTAPQISNFSMYGNVLERCGRAYFDALVRRSELHRARVLSVYLQQHGLRASGEGLCRTREEGMGERSRSGMVIDDQAGPSRERLRCSRDEHLLRPDLTAEPSRCSAQRESWSRWEIDDNCYFGGSVFNVGLGERDICLCGGPPSDEDGAGLFDV